MSPPRWRASCKGRRRCCCLRGQKQSNRGVGVDETTSGTGRRAIGTAVQPRGVGVMASHGVSAVVVATVLGLFVATVVRAGAIAALVMIRVVTAVVATTGMLIAPLVLRSSRHVRRAE